MKTSASLFILTIAGLFPFASSACLDGQFIRTNLHSGQVVETEMAANGEFSAKIVFTGQRPEAIRGSCTESSDGSIKVQFQRSAGSRMQTFEGVSSEVCGEKAFEGTMSDGASTHLWHSLPAIRSFAKSCATVLPMTPEGYKTSGDCVPGFKSAAEIKRGQCLLNRLVWGAKPELAKLNPEVKENARSPIRLSHPESVGSVRVLKFKMPHGFESHVYFFKNRNAGAGPRRLAIFHQGHGHDLGAYGGLETIEFFLERGYDVLGVLMPQMGPNVAPSGVKTHDDIFSFLRRQTTNNSFDGLAYFLAPTVSAIEFLAKPGIYASVLMTGISGGGWTTTWVAALDSRVDFAVPVAGSLPLSLRVKNSMGDLEQYRKEVYSVVGYADLYALGSFGRKYIQVSNQTDPCCFAVDAPPAYVQSVQSLLKKTDPSGKSDYEFWVDRSHRDHKISSWVLDQLRRELR